MPSASRFSLLRPRQRVASGKPNRTIRQTSYSAYTIPDHNGRLFSEAGFFGREWWVLGRKRIPLSMKSPPHPGDLINTEIIEALGLSVSRAAEILKVAARRSPIFFASRRIEAG